MTATTIPSARERVSRIEIASPVYGRSWLFSFLLFAAGIAALPLTGAAAQPSPPASPSATQPARTDSAVAASDTTSPSHRVIAYYFHTTFRCDSCRKIEMYSKEAIEVAFPKEIESGRIIWRVVNVEEKGNEHFVKDYQIYTKSLVLVDERGGRQARWKNAAKVWELLRDKKRFVEYVQSETRAYLADRS